MDVGSVSSSANYWKLIPKVYAVLISKLTAVAGLNEGKINSLKGRVVGGRVGMYGVLFQQPYGTTHTVMGNERLHQHAVRRNESVLYSLAPIPLRMQRTVQCTNKN